MSEIKLGNATRIIFGTPEYPQVPLSRSKDVYHRGVTVDSILSGIIDNYWVAGGGITARAKLAGCGNTNAALSFGGTNVDIDTYMDTTETFDGTTWSSSSSMISARYGLAGCGNINAALAFGGAIDPEGDNIETTEVYNGSNWSNINNSSLKDRGNLAGCGSVNSALAFGGLSDESTNLSITERFNGLVWCIVGTMLTDRNCLAGCGNTNAALAFGGTDVSTSPNKYSSATEAFDGLQWSSKSDMPSATTELAGCGNIMDAISFGGYNGALVFNDGFFNGYVWSVGSIGYVCVQKNAGCGNASTALSFGGVSETEEGNSIYVGYTYIFSRAHSLSINGIYRYINVLSGLGGSGSVNKVMISDVSFLADTWTYDSELALYTYIHELDDIFEDSIVNVNFKTTSIPYAEFFGVSSSVGVSSGSLTLYSDNQPTEDLIADIVIL